MRARYAPTFSPRAAWTRIEAMVVTTHSLNDRSVAMPAAASVKVQSVDFGVRPMSLRLPFKFGAVTLRHCPQLFVRATVSVDGAKPFTGWAAEMMMPRWFDKRTERSQADNVRDLTASAEAAAAAYVANDAASPFGLFAANYAKLIAKHQSAGMTALSAAYGQAVLDRAVLDAVCRSLGVSVFDAFRQNRVGLCDTPVAPDLAGWNWDGWLSRSIVTPATLEARHTVGMLDTLDGEGVDASGLPTTLRSVIARYGHRFFKIKLGGDPVIDLARLDAVLAVLNEAQPGHRFSLDGNEQYVTAAALATLCEGLRQLPRLAARPDALLYIEQPLPRDASMDPALADLDAPAPLLLDEADGTLDAFVQGRTCGWQGVSSKSCKGIYKAVINRARCDQWNAEEQEQNRAAPDKYFMSAEDLTCQAGLSVQQDLALVALLGLTHVERNGHHYVDGFGPAPASEAEAFAAAHPGLYSTSGGAAHLSINGGVIAIGSLAETGFAHLAEPDFSSLQPLAEAAFGVSDD